ncbi:hypothetical protein BDV12DRAFT_167253, partial [Aspergillus spectabilis]
MGKTFRKIHASTVGDFENNTSNIPQWVTANGGNYSRDATEAMTHIISTPKMLRLV